MRYVTVKLTVVEPDDGPMATDEELTVAIEEACAGLGTFDVDAETHEDGTEVWSINQATVVGIIH